MSKIEPLGAKARDSSDWNHAWKVVSRLAAARGTTLRQVGEDDRKASTRRPAPGANPGSNAAATAPARLAPIAPNQLVRDIAEIERAAAALRRAEPALEQCSPLPEASAEPRPSHSIWPLICVIWLTALLVVSCAVGAIVLLLG
jgi:hypothetical protein